MQVIIEIPKEYEEDFKRDKFKHDLTRVLMDSKAWSYDDIAGLHEHETIEMIMDSFEDSIVLPENHGRLIDADELTNSILCKTFGLRSVDIENAPTIIEAVTRENPERYQ